MIKVLHIVNRFNLGGHVYKPLYLAKHLPENYEMLIVGGTHTENEESAEFLFKKEAITFTLIPEMSRNISIKDDFKAFVKLIKIIRKFKPDIIHTHASKAGLLGRLAGFFCGTKVIVHTFHGHVFHSYFSKWKTQIFIWIEKIMSAISSGIIAVSDKQKYELTKVFKVAPAKKTYSIPIGLNLDSFYNLSEVDAQTAREQFRINSKDIVISIVGRLVPIKNHQLFIDVIGQLKAKGHKNIKALIVGDGELKEELMEQCHNLGLKTDASQSDYDVYFTSWIKDVSTVYAASDIVALTSHNEGTPVTLIEAQVAKKPIVSTDAGGTRDILIPSKYNLISEPDADKFSDAIINLIKNLEDDSFMDNVSREKIYHSYSQITMVKNMDAFYKKMLND